MAPVIDSQSGISVNNFSYIHNGRLLWVVGHFRFPQANQARVLTGASVCDHERALTKITC